jgi:hypothetical protein
MRVANARAAVSMMIALLACLVVLPANESIQGRQLSEDGARGIKSLRQLRTEHQKTEYCGLRLASSPPSLLLSGGLCEVRWRNAWRGHENWSPLQSKEGIEALHQLRTEYRINRILRPRIGFFSSFLAVVWRPVVRA